MNHRRFEKTRRLSFLSLLVLFILCVSGCGEKAAELPPATETETEAPVYREFFEGTADDVLIPVETESEELERETESENEPEAVPGDEEDLVRKRTEKKLSDMTLNEKVAQLFYITPEALTGISPVTEAGAETEAAFNACPVGGLIYSEQNAVDEKQLQAMLGAVQGFALKNEDLPLFLGVDEEGGRVRRIGSNEGVEVPEIASMAEYAALGSSAVKEAADQIGTYLNLYGFNMDFAPDADVLTNPENEVIGERSFGPDPALVSECAAAYASALQSHEIIPVYKHFPGHGGTASDTHQEAAALTEDYETLFQREWVPFRSGIDSGIQVIMAGHIALPNVTDDDLPATLSKDLIEGTLRGELGFDGIVITDALQMKAISDRYSSADAAVKALEAGCDMLLMPADFGEAYQGVLSAVQQGILSEERINESVRRILTVKYRWMKDSLVGLKDSDAGEYFYYIDAHKRWHSAYLNPELPKNDYDPALFRKENGRLYYDDPRYEVQQGIDVSRHNGDVDFMAVKAAGFDFVILRGAYRGYGEDGALHIDELFSENLRKASEAGLDIGVYVFSQAITEAEALEEAELIISELNGVRLSLPVVFDPESIQDDEARTDHVSGEQFTKNTLVFCERIKEAGYEPMIYSNMIWEADVLDLSRLKQYPIWYADYEDIPQSPYWFSMLQYAEDGTAPGVEGIVDLNIRFQKK